MNIFKKIFHKKEGDAMGIKHKKSEISSDMIFTQKE